MQYGYKKLVSLPFGEAVKKVKEILADEGFGVLTEIDVKATFKQKLDIEYDEYVILGACNPSFALKALTTEKEIGLLLPCNVVVYEDASHVYVSSILPTIAMKMVENESLQKIAEEVEVRLKAAMDALT